MKRNFLTTTAIVTLSILSLSQNGALANPEGGQVVGGSATISEVGNKLDVHQHTDRAVIDWRSFDIEADEHTQFHQPSSSATALNRINDVNPSRIAGQLSANGNIILVNPNGVFFDGSARVDVNGIVATTANIRADEFMAGSNNFNIPGNPNAAIVNNGLITAREAGLVGLVAPNVENNGIIQARMGRVELASGDTVTIDFYGDDLLKVEVQDDNLKSQYVGNKGILAADGGVVAMTAAAAQDTVNSLIVAGGVIGAQSIGMEDGAIIIGGEGTNKTDKTGNSYVAVTGILDASGRDEGERGGSIEILGDHIAVTETAFLDTSGFEAFIPERKPDNGSATMREDKSIDNGVRTEEDFLAQSSRAGGSIKIGGDYLGKGETQTAKTVNVDQGAIIVNDAIDKGDGGRTIIWSDETTEFAGLVLSRGGEHGGHGGFVETSGKAHLKAEGYADLTNREEGYSKGTYLLDPTNITIYGNFDPNDPVTETELWLDAADSSTLDCGTGLGNCSNTDLLQSWTDKSGNVGNDASVTGGQEPEFRSADINGRSSIYFDGTLDIPITGALNRTNASSSFFSVYFQESAGGNDKAIFEAEGNGDRYFLIDRRFAGSTNYATLFDQTTLLNADAFGTGTAAVYRDGATVNAAYGTGGFDQGRVLDTYTIGDDTTGNNEFRGWISEVLIYDGALSTNDRNLVEQYLATKWNITLTPDGTGATEVERATASDGYSAFTTDYLERLSASADIVLQADNTITLDLQGDTLALDTGRSLSLTTTNGNISDTGAMTGTVRTDNGNITLFAGGSGDIDLDNTNLEATNGGLVNLYAFGGSANVTQDSALNIGVVNAQNFALETTGASNTVSFTNDSGNLLGRSQGVTNTITTNDGNVTFNDAVLLADHLTINTGTGNVNFTDTVDSVFYIPDPDVLSSGVLWFDANDLDGDGIAEGTGEANFNGTNITGWVDKTLNGNDGAASTADLGDINGNTSVVFDNNTNIVVAPDAFAGSTNEIYIFSVTQENNRQQNFFFNFNGTNTGSGGGATGRLSMHVPWSDSNWYWDAGGTGGRRSQINGPTAVGEVTQATFYNSVSRNERGIVLNGGAFDDINAGAASVVTTDGLQIGRFNGAAGNIELGELIAFDQDLSTRDVDIIETYLSDKWQNGITLGTDYDLSITAGDVTISGNTGASQALNDLSIIAQGSVTLADIDAGSIDVRSGAGNDIILNGDLAATDAGNALVLSSGQNFVNNAGVNALDASNAAGRWLVYSSDPAANTLGGLAFDFKRYNRTFAGNAPATITETDNGLIYSISPVLTYNVDDLIVEFGEALGAQGITFASGLIDGDTFGTIGQVGSANLTSTYTPGDASGIYIGALTATVGTFANDLGYQYAFNAGDLTVNATPVSETDVVNETVIPPTVEQDFVNNNVINPTATINDFSTLQTQSPSLPNSQIDIEVEGLTSVEKNNNLIPNQSLIKLKIERELVDDLNLEIKDGLL